MEIVLIAAVAKNRVIGNKDKLPWYISADLKRFKELTLNNAVIMGKKTYESILSHLGKPLPKRKNIVLTTDSNYQVPAEVEIAKDIKEALKKSANYEKVFIIGGERVFSEFLKKDMVSKLELTQIKKDFEGDVYFPEIDLKKWNEVKKEDLEENGIKFSFVSYVKKP